MSHERAPKIFVAQTVTLIFTVKNQDGGIVDLSTGTLKLYLKHPSQAPKEVTPSFVSDGTDGKIQYATLITDLNIPGIWKIQADIYIDALQDYTSDIASFEVFANLRK